MKDSFVFVIVIMLILVLIITNSYALVMITPDQNISDIKELVKFSQRIKEINMEIKLNEDGSLDEVIEQRILTLDEWVINESIVAPLSFYGGKDYENIEIVDLTTNKEFNKVNSLTKSPACHYQFTFDPELNKGMFCMPVSEGGDINYKIKTHINPQYDYKNVYSPKYVQHSILYSFDILDYSYPVSFSLYGGDNILLDYYDMNDSCDSEDFSYIPLSNGFKCKGTIKPDQDHPYFGFNITAKGYNKEILEQEKEMKQEEKKERWETKKWAIGLIVSFLGGSFIGSLIGWNLKNRNNQAEYY